MDACVWQVLLSTVYTARDMLLTETQQLAHPGASPEDNIPPVFNTAVQDTVNYLMTSLVSMTSALQCSAATATVMLDCLPARQVLQDVVDRWSSRLSGIDGSSSMDRTKFLSLLRTETALTVQLYEQLQPFYDTAICEWVALGLPNLLHALDQERVLACFLLAASPDSDIRHLALLPSLLPSHDHGVRRLLQLGLQSFLTNPVLSADTYDLVLNVLTAADDSILTLLTTIVSQTSAETSEA
jgi:hypothetical protein